MIYRYYIFLIVRHPEISESNRLQLSPSRFSTPCPFADDWEQLLMPEIERLKKLDKDV